MALASKLGTSFMFFLAFVTQVHADPQSSVAAFDKVCVSIAPSFPADGTAFANLGYTAPTQDQAVFAKSGDGFAGIGYAGREWEPRSSNTPNGCLVYSTGLDAAGLAIQADAIFAKRFKIVERQTIGNDRYWIIRDFTPRVFVAIVAPKTEGAYAGHTLLMLTEQSPRPATTKTAPIYSPEGKAVAEELRKRSPQDRMAYLGAMQFGQCFLAGNFNDIEFDKEIGVERVETNVPGKNQFVDSTTGNVMMTTEQTCIVGFSGNNVKFAFESVQPLISMRDKTAKFLQVTNGYQIELNLSGKPHVVEMVAGKVTGRDFVRLMLKSKAQKAP